MLQAASYKLFPEKLLEACGLWPAAILYYLRAFIRLKMKKTKVLLIGAGGQLGSELTQGLWKIYGQENVIASDIKDAQGILKEGPYEKFDVMQRDKLFDLIKKTTSLKSITWPRCFLPLARKIRDGHGS